MVAGRRGRLRVGTPRGTTERGGRTAVLIVLLALLALTLPASADAIVEGHITGKVTAASGGTAIDGLYLCADATVGNAYACGDTETKGEYSLEVPEGHYIVEFYSENCVATCHALNYLDQYWKNTSDYEEAEEVVVKAGTTTSGIGAAMKAGGILEGTVEAGGREVEGDEVCAYSDELEYVYRCFDTGEEGLQEGAFELVGLPTEHYRLEFYPDGDLVGQYYKDARTEEAATRVELVAGTVKPGLNAELKIGGRIEGLVTAAVGGAPVSDIEVCPRTVGTAAYAECTRTNSEGKYTLEALEGEYGVGFEGNGSTLGPELYESATSEAAEKHIKTTSGGTVKGINGSLPTSGEITGLVTAAPSGSAVAGVQVCADSELDFESCGRTNSAGEYTIKGVVGNYRVEFEGSEACTPGCVSLPYDYQYFNGVPDYERAQVLTVTSGGSVTGVNARLAKTAKQLEEETENRKIAEAVAKIRAEEAAEQAAAAASAAKHAQEVKAAEEAAKRKAAEERAHAEAAAAASFKIVRFHVTGTTLVITLKLPRAETLTLSASDVKRLVVHLGTGTHIVKLHLTAAGRSARTHRRKIEMSFSVKEGAFVIVLSKPLKL